MRMSWLLKLEMWNIEDMFVWVCRGVLRKGFCKILILKGKNGVSNIHVFWDFLDREIRYRLRNCTRTFFIKIPKNLFMHFRNSNFQGHKGVKRGYLRHSSFWHFLGRKIRYHFRNCTKTFFIQIPKNQCLYFSKF